MSLSQKILIGLGAALLLIISAIFVYERISYKAELKAISDQLTAQKQLTDNITRSMSTYATKDDMNTFAKDANVNLDAIRKDLATLNANLTAINKVTVDSKGENQTNIPSTSTTPNQNPNQPTATCNGKKIPCDNADPYGYMKNVQTLHLDEDFTDGTKVPIGNVQFDAAKDKPWGANISPREYTSVTTLGVDEDQKYTAYNKFSIKADGKEYPIKVNTAQMVQQYPEPHFTFMPRLYLGTDGGVNFNNTSVTNGIQPALTPNLSVGVIGYGKYRNQPDLSILQVGAGYDAVGKNFQITVVPVAYNLGSKIPLMSNFYVGPSVSVDIKGNVTAGLGIRVGL